jgi:hypothetical protein
MDEGHQTLGEIMGLREEFLTALRSGQGHGPLLDLVRRYRAQGMTVEEAYDILEGIWLDFGYDDSLEESPLRDDLEFVMERVWYGFVG